MLDTQRTTILSKIDGLTSEQLADTVPPSDLTLAGLIKHLACVEDHWFQHTYLGEPFVEPWASAPFDDDSDWEFNSAIHDSSETLRNQYLESIARSDAVVAATPNLTDMCAPSSEEGWNHPDLRWVLLHMIEETARHLGHADLIRQSIDGAIGY